MSSGPKGSEEGLAPRCSVCSRCEELFELPGIAGKYCLRCSADWATAALLTTEIDAATLAGRSATKLTLEFEELCTRLLARSQSEGLGY